jgi:hypothetical protein
MKNDLIMPALEVFTRNVATSPGTYSYRPEPSATTRWASSGLNELYAYFTLLELEWYL